MITESDEETKQLFEEAKMLLSDLQQSVSGPADAMLVLCMAMATIDRDYRKPGNTVENCIKLMGDSLREIEASYAKSH